MTWEADINYLEKDYIKTDGKVIKKELGKRRKPNGFCQNPNCGKMLVRKVYCNVVCNQTAWKLREEY